MTEVLVSRRRGFLIHAAAFLAGNALTFALQHRRGELRRRGVAIQLASWGAGLAWHYLQAVRQPLPVERCDRCCIAAS